ncbi:TetR/AcrR family transcriptional regulator [Granulicoccus phenolivorans]|uniref:TetR/AcrR family transcriptional regulator n=1 Tax=Granulicoccus phenolivorans TaxID=266854 RepID=UPI0004038132|nr:TetR/AcrR family transcriptional regulator [Granulicoccus phenolivorans]
MPREPSPYHQQVAARNRQAILEAAGELFLETGYDRTSLARVAEQAGVSRATLFKQFPTKAELFEAVVLTAGSASTPEVAVPPVGDLYAGLVILGTAYVELLSRPRMENLIRTLIAASLEFPELRGRTFDFGTFPVFVALDRYLRAETEAGFARVADPGTAASQFLGMISTVVFWPRLIHGGWSLGPVRTREVVEEAARTMAARYAGPEQPA